MKSETVERTQWYVFQGTQGQGMLSVSWGPGIRNWGDTWNGVCYTFLTSLSLSFSLSLCFSLCIFLIHISLHLCLYVCLSLFSSLCTLQNIDIPTWCPWVYIITSPTVTGIFESKFQLPEEGDSGWLSFGRGLDNTTWPADQPMWLWSQQLWEGGMDRLSKRRCQGREWWEAARYSGLLWGVNRIMGNVSVQSMRTQCSVSTSNTSCKRS